MLRLLKIFVAGWLVSLSAAAALAQDRPQVIAVNYALKYFAERLLEEDAEVLLPVPDGVDPSFWRPSIADISTIQSADLILLNGAGFATWVDRVSLPRSKVVNTTAAVEDQFIVTESITHSHGDGGEHSHEGLASYTWLDPILAIAQAEAVAGAISARAIASEDAVSERLAALRADLEALDAQASSALGSMGDATIVATHPRYQYLARRYGLNIVSLEWEAGEAPTTDQLTALEMAVADNDAAVLVWEAEPPATAFEKTAGLGLENIVFAPLARATVDATFLDIFANAVSEISEAGGN